MKAVLHMLYSTSSYPPHLVLDKFLADLEIDGCIIQVGEKDTVSGYFTKTLEIPALVSEEPERDLFFVGGVNPSKGKERAKDEDITKKNYIYFDIDVRKTLEFDSSDEDIKRLAETKFLPLLNDSKFSSWRYVVFTGNGLHVYYFSEDPVEIKATDFWRMGMAQLVKEFSDVIDTPVDRQCVNAARIARLPGSYNNKQEPKLVEILFTQDCYSNIISCVEEAGRAEAAKITEENKKKETHDLLLSPSEADNFKRVNSIPIATVVQKVTGWETDGRDFWEPQNKKRKACFVPPGSNCLIHGGTDHLPETYPAFSCFNFVKAKLNYDNSQAFFWFRDKFPEAFVVIPENPQGNFSEVWDQLMGTTAQELTGPEGFDDLRLIVRGAVTRIGALPGTGKSTFAYFLAETLAYRGYKGLFFSTEVSADAVAAGISKIATGIDAWDLRTKKRILTAEESMDIKKLFRKFSIFDSKVHKNSFRDIEGLIAGAFAADPSDPPVFIIVDFCQMLSSKKSSADTFASARQYAIEAQEIAQKYNVAFICLSQLGPEAADDKVILASTIPYENSKTLFAVADIATMLRRNPSVLGTYSTLYVKKHKYLQQLPTPVYLQFDRKFATYERSSPPMIDDSSIMK